MRSYSLNELFRLTRNQLFALHAETAAALTGLADGAAERPILLETLRNIRRVLARPNLSP
jgi:hypothetical protein